MEQSARIQRRKGNFDASKNALLASRAGSHAAAGCQYVCQGKQRLYSGGQLQQIIECRSSQYITSPTRSLFHLASLDLVYLQSTRGHEADRAVHCRPRPPIDWGTLKEPCAHERKEGGVGVCVFPGRPYEKELTLLGDTWPSMQLQCGRVRCPQPSPKPLSRLGTPP